MKLKIGKDLINREHVLVIPNQITFVFDFDFTTLKLITKEGTKTIDIDINNIRCRYLDSKIDLNNSLHVRSSGTFYYSFGSSTMFMNHHHIKNMIMFLIEAVPFNTADHNFEDISLIKEIKCYETQFIITYNDNTGKKISTNDLLLSHWQYYFNLRDLKNGETIEITV